MARCMLCASQVGEHDATCPHCGGTVTTDDTTAPGGARDEAAAGAGDTTVVSDPALSGGEDPTWTGDAGYVPGAFGVPPGDTYSAFADHGAAASPAAPPASGGGAGPTGPVTGPFPVPSVGWPPPAGLAQDPAAAPDPWASGPAATAPGSPWAGSAGVADPWAGPGSGAEAGGGPASVGAIGDGGVADGYGHGGAAYGYGGAPTGHGAGGTAWPATYTPPRRLEAMALASILTSAFGLLLTLGCGVTIVACPVGAVLGHASLRRIASTGDSGRGLALAGIIVGWLGTALLALGLGVLVAVLVAA